MPSSPRCRRNRPRSPSPVSAPPPARVWAALPRDLLFSVFLKLGPGEILRGADRACAAWRRVAVEEPALWRRVDMGAVPVRSRRWRAAIDRGAGQCESFSGRRCDDLSLMYLVERAPTLKTLRLLGASLSHHVLHEAIQKLPLLESLEVSLWDFNESAYEKLFPSVCEACPCLKKISLRLITSYSYGYDYEKDMAILDGAKCRIPIMRELRSLELNKCRLTEMKLMAIINNCPVLESLYINVCFISRVSKMVEWIQAKYARVKVLAVIADSDEECYA